MSTCNRLDLQTLGSQPIMHKNFPGHWSWLIIPIRISNKYRHDDHPYNRGLDTWSHLCSQSCVTLQSVYWDIGMDGHPILGFRIPFYVWTIYKQAMQRIGVLWTIWVLFFAIGCAMTILKIILTSFRKPTTLDPSMF